MVLSSVAKRETPMRIGFILPEPMKYSLVLFCWRPKYQPNAIVEIA